MIYFHSVISLEWTDQRCISVWLLPFASYVGKQVSRFLRCKLMHLELFSFSALVPLPIQWKLVVIATW